MLGAPLDTHVTELAGRHFRGSDQVSLHVHSAKNPNKAQLIVSFLILLHNPSATMQRTRVLLVQKHQLLAIRPKGSDATDA